MAARFGFYESGNKDDDLNDILKTYGGDGNNSNGGVNNNKSEEMKPLNLETLSEGNLDVPVKRSTGGAGANPCYSLLRLCCLYSSYACELAPKCCCALAGIAIVVPAYFIVLALMNPLEEFGFVANDYTSITSEYDLTVGKIDHWCLQGDNDSCMCEDPLQPQPRGQWKKWTTAHEANKLIVKNAMDSGLYEPDIAFLGASVVEEMDGRWFGEVRDDPTLKSIGSYFNTYFNTDGGSSLNAVALGVAGDTSPSILWRLLNGEMPEDFEPRIWWLEVGMNDLGRAQCSEEVVVLGVLRVVEEILKKPDAIVVINSLFPMADLRGGLQVGGKDYMQIKSKQDYIKMMQERKKAAGARVNSNYAKGKYNGGGFGGNSDLGERAGVVKAVGQNKAHGGHHRNLLWPFGGGGGGDNGGGFRSNDKKEVKLDANKHTQKKYTPLSHHERKLPLWTSIAAINKELKKFASKHDRVKFFDATEIFAEKDEGAVWILKKDMITLRGHPTPAGFKVWESKVADYAMKLLADILV